MSDYEMRVIEFESARNEAMDSYFNARPQLMRTGEQEKLFEAGFRMAWESAKTKWLPIETAAPKGNNPRCLAWTPGPASVMKERIIPDGLLYTARDATHWMPLPPPPEAA